jgi:hypothetical protein
MRITLLILLTAFLSSYAFAGEKYDRRLDRLVLRAKILETKINQTDAKHPDCELKLEVTFTNEGSEPIIILQQAEDYNGFRDFIFASGVEVFGANQNGSYPIQNFNALPSICTACNENLGKLLDRTAPPDKYTKILKPQESVTLIQETAFGLSLKTSNGLYGWDEIEKNNWKILGRINYSMFPINLGKYGKNFGHKLQKRWQKYGLLYVRDTHSLISSEEFQIDLTGVKF